MRKLRGVGVGPVNWGATLGRPRSGARSKPHGVVVVVFPKFIVECGKEGRGVLWLIAPNQKKEP